MSTQLTSDTRLSPHQLALLDDWLPAAVIDRDHSWDLGARAVLEVRWSGERFIVKAGGPEDHHMAREITAHERWLEPWTSMGRAPQAVRADTEARLLVCTYLPGDLILGTPHADEPTVYEQAGRLLRALHDQCAHGLPGAVGTEQGDHGDGHGNGHEDGNGDGHSGERDDHHEVRENARSLRWLDSRHRIPPDIEARLREEIASWPTPPATLVPTHGDWQPRNWLIHEGEVAVIDFGRAGLRPAMTDFGRLAAQDFLRDPRLEEAFLAGYGTDPRESEAWQRVRIREAIGTAVWAHQVGDATFEAQGHAMIAAALNE